MVILCLVLDLGMEVGFGRIGFISFLVFILRVVVRFFGIVLEVVLLVVMFLFWLVGFWIVWWLIFVFYFVSSVGKYWRIY